MDCANHFTAEEIDEFLVNSGFTKGSKPYLAERARRFMPVSDVSCCAHIKHAGFRERDDWNIPYTPEQYHEDGSLNQEAVNLLRKAFAT